MFCYSSNSVLRGYQYYIVLRECNNLYLEVQGLVRQFIFKFYILVLEHIRLDLLRVGRFPRLCRQVCRLLWKLWNIRISLVCVPRVKYDMNA